ncbi:MAG: tetratricopeptide repeat protein [Akkermansiaceae bacterium]
MASIEKAISLRNIHRYDDALAELHLLLAQDPENAFVHFQIALTYSAMPEGDEKALEAINGALGIEPTDPDYLSTKALILVDLDRDKEALKVADEALVFDPDSYQWYARASALSGLRKWKDAKEACDKALEIDPDYNSALNLKNVLSRVQGDLDSADRGTMEQLSRNAENPVALSNAGWTQLQRGERAKAEELFREALRIQPNNEYARSGLVEAFKSRSLFYRLYLKWVFMIQRMEGKSQWVLFIGLYLGYRLGRELLAKVHPLLGVAMVVLYFGFCFGSFLAPGIGSGLLLKDRFARLALSTREKWDGLLVSVLFIGGVLLAIIGLIAGLNFVTYLGSGMLIAAIPASLVVRNLSKQGQLVFGGIALFVVFGALHSWYEFATTGEVISGVGAFSLLAAMLSTWLTSSESLVKLR